MSMKTSIIKMEGAEIRSGQLPSADDWRVEGESSKVKMQRTSRLGIWSLALFLFLGGCTGPRSYTRGIKDQLLSQTIAANEVTRPSEHEALLHAEAVLVYYDGRFTTLTGAKDLRKIQKDEPTSWPRHVRVVRMDGMTKKEESAEEKRLREFVDTIQGRGR